MQIANKYCYSTICSYFWRYFQFIFKITVQLLNVDFPSWLSVLTFFFAGEGEGEGDPFKNELLEPCKTSEKLCVLYHFLFAKYEEILRPYGPYYP